MTSEQVKIFLDSLITKEDRDFFVRLSRRRTKRCMASYHSGRKEIVIYNGEKSEKTILESLRILSLGLHKLSHHIDHKRNKHAWYALRLSGRRRSLHGATFIKTLDSLIDRFNFLYRKHLKGVIFFDRRRPTRPPIFVRLEKAKREIIDKSEMENKTMKSTRSRIPAIYESATKKTQGWIMTQSSIRAWLRQSSKLRRTE